MLFAIFSISSIDRVIFPNDFDIASFIRLILYAFSDSDIATSPPIAVAIPVIPSAAGLSEPKLIRAFIKCTELDATLYESIAAPIPSNTDST